MPEEKKESRARGGAEILIFKLLLIGIIAFIFTPPSMNIMILQLILGMILGISFIMFVKTSYYTYLMRKGKEKKIENEETK